MSEEPVGIVECLTFVAKSGVPTIDPSVAPRAVKQWLASLVPTIDEAISRRLEPPDDGDPGQLFEAMRYAALGPGKRLRPALVIAACEAVGGELGDALPAAAAIEMLHAYTLVHDDLPAMDDDDIRRGRPTVHKQFNEAIAILAGDGLLTAAFEALSELGARAADAVAVLARRSGSRELIAGQARDLTIAAQSDEPDFETVERVHRAKTGALFAAATELGGIAGGASASQRDALARYGMAIGVAFQHADDRDDGEFSAHAARARERMRTLTEEAIQRAAMFGAAGERLTSIAMWWGSRA